MFSILTHVVCDNIDNDSRCMCVFHCVVKKKTFGNFRKSSTTRREGDVPVQYATSEGLGVVALLSELGREVQLRVHCDSSAAIGIVNRSGLGRTRHLDVQLLWIQEQVKCGRVCLLKCPGGKETLPIH
jgi:hypothetical protein